MKIKTIFLFTLLSILLQVSNAEGVFKVKIFFPLSINLKKISIEYHDGFKTIPIKVNPQERLVQVSVSCYSKFLCLIISYSHNDSLVTYPKRYFLSNNSSLTYYDNPKKNLDSVMLVNAYTFGNMGERRFNLYAKNELNDLDDFLKVNRNHLDDSLIYQKFIAVDAKVQTKKLKFIEANNTLFYSLWTFKEEFVSNYDYKAESLSEVYKHLFEAKFSNTFEAKQIVNILGGRINRFKGNTAPLFSGVDYLGNNIQLLRYRDEKYVLLNFWASWCGPCVAEMPILDSIYSQYSKKDIAIISISEDRNKEKFLKLRQRLQMNWVNIYNDPLIEGVYGNNPSLPQVYLIDKKGQIIYSRTEEQDSDLKKLLEILKNINLKRN